MSKALLRSGAIFTAANLLAAAIPFFLLPILTRALTPQEYGQVVAFFMLVSLTSCVAGLGLNGAVSVKWFSDASHAYKRAFTGTALACVAASTVLTGLAASWLAPLAGIDLLPLYCGLAAVCASAIIVQSMRFSVYQAQQQPIKAAALQVGSSILNFSLSMVAVLAWNLGAGGRIGAAAAAGLLVTGWCAITLWRSGDATLLPSADHARTLMRFGIPLIPHGLAGALLGNIDRLAVSTILSASDLGIYGAATQLGLILSVLADAAVKALTPSLYGALSSPSLRGRLRFVGLSYAALPAWLICAGLLWLILKLVGGLILGPRFIPAIDLSLMFLIGNALFATYLNIAATFFFTGKTGSVSIASVSATAITALIAWPLVSSLGIYGGALTYITAQGCTLIAAFLLSLKVMPLPWSRPGLAFRTLFNGARA